MRFSKPKGKSFLVNTWFRPPNSQVHVFDDFELCVQRMDVKNNEIIIIGDYNCDWSRHPERGKSQIKRLVETTNNPLKNQHELLHIPVV